MFDNRGAKEQGRRHLLLPFGDQRIMYAYIRKNGCSAFKLAMGMLDADWTERVSAYQWTPSSRSDASIFVWRDPVERLVSLYRNKIIDQQQNLDITRTYRETMGEDASTFARFVELAVTGADPHCIQQHKHLMPIVYTHAVPLERLHESMVEIVGEVAAEPFRHRVNASPPTPVEISDRAMDLIRSYYACDFKMIEQMEGVSAGYGIGESLTHAEAVQSR